MFHQSFDYVKRISNDTFMKNGQTTILDHFTFDCE